MAASSKVIVQALVFLCNFSFIWMAISSYKQPWYATKTPYFWLTNNEDEMPDDGDMWLDYGQSSCQAIHFNAVFRHGARFPGVKWIKRMTELHKNILKNGNAEKYPFLDNWVNPFPESKEKLLSELGEDEHYDLGSRFGKRFSLLLEDEMDNVKFVVSSKQRTQASAAAFHDGLTSSVPSSDDSEDNIQPIVDDIALRFHDNCNKYKVSVDKNDTAMSEYNSFKSGPEVKSVGDEIKEKLGIPITPNDINTIYQLCAFEEALSEQESSWCQFLNEENLPIIEYLNDLKQYWKKAYGFNITAEMSCPLMSGIFDQIDEVIRKNEQGKDHNVATFQFGHAETLAPLYAALSLFKDEPQLKANNFKEQLNRKFSSSKILPFSANIAVVLYECDSGDAPEGSVSEDEQFLYIVKILVNEKEVEIPACNSNVCPYKEFREFYQNYVNHCDFHKLCRTGDKAEHDEL